MAKMVDEIYADEFEVFTPLQDIYFVKMRKSKKRWRSVELSTEKSYKMRRMDIVWKIAKDNIIALEAKVSATMINGEIRNRWFAAFLTFENGKIVIDHTYMKDPEPITSMSKNQ